VVTLDTDLDNPYPHLAYSEMNVKNWPTPGKAPACVRDLDILMENPDGWVRIAQVRDNYRRRVVVPVEMDYTATAIKIVVLATNGASYASMYAIQVYEAP
jgi:hypothetical protein